MPFGLDLAKAHIASFVAGRTSDFDAQLSPTFRYVYLPPIMGAGAAQARRWRDLIYSVYRAWDYEILDAEQIEGEVFLRVKWRGYDPVEPENTPPEFFDSSALMFSFSGARLTSCKALYLDYDEHPEFRSLPAKAGKRVQH